MYDDITEGVINGFISFGVNPNHIVVVNDQVTLTKMGVIEFGVGQIILAGNNPDSMSNDLRNTIINLYEFLNSVCDGKTILSGELEGFKMERSTFSGSDLINLLYSIYINKTIAMGEFFDIKDKLITFKKYFGSRIYD